MLKMFLIQIEARGNTTTLSFRENRPSGIPGGKSGFQYNPREPKSGATSGQPKLDSIFLALREKSSFIEMSKQATPNTKNDLFVRSKIWKGSSKNM